MKHARNKHSQQILLPASPCDSQLRLELSKLGLCQEAIYGGKEKSEKEIREKPRVA